MEHPAVVVVTVSGSQAVCPCGWRGTEWSYAIGALDEADEHALGIEVLA
jgi:hypothetical protein